MIARVVPTAIALCLVLFAGPSTSLRSDDAKVVAKPTARAQFDLLKSLKGDWTGKAGHGETTFDATVSYRVTSGGSAVQETLFAGTDHEMITMYHLNGDKLLLTHYCAAGNQPRMQAQSSDNPKKIVFDFLDGTNLDPTKDLFMHDAVIELVADGHLKSEWTSFQNGKRQMTAKFDLKRQPAAR